jgi:threonine synthase
MSVADALGISADNDMEALEKISQKTALKIPVMIKQLFAKPVIHEGVVDQEKIREEMLAFL